MNLPNAELQIRVYGVDGSLSVFTQDDSAQVQRIIQNVQRPDFFRQDRITIAARHSVTTMVVGRIARIDLAGKGVPTWQPPFKLAAGLRDIVEVTEQEFLYQAEVWDFNHVERRRQHHQPGQTQLGFVDIQLVGEHHIYLRFTLEALLPAERLQRVRSLLTLPALSFRLASGGFGIANLTNALKFTGKPGPPEVPADAWSADEEDGENQEALTRRLEARSEVV